MSALCFPPSCAQLHASLWHTLPSSSRGGPVSGRGAVPRSLSLGLRRATRSSHARTTSSKRGWRLPAGTNVSILAASPASIATHWWRPLVVSRHPPRSRHAPRHALLLHARRRPRLRSPPTATFTRSSARCDRRLGLGLGLANPNPNPNPNPNANPNPNPNPNPNANLTRCRRATAPLPSDDARAAPSCARSTAGHRLRTR